ncbi:MAG: hypothetical protein V4482_01015 [Pseudomonadota bacterium]
MSKDVLLIRSNQFHLAVPTERLLEIVNLENYHAQQKQKLKTTAPNGTADQHRLWRNHVLPVLHMSHFLEPTKLRPECSFGLVYQASKHETIFLDIDHVFGIFHLDISKMKPIYHPNTEVNNTIPMECSKPQKEVIAYILEESMKHKNEP